MKVKDKKNNFVIAGLVLFLIIIIFGQQGNTFAGASNMEAAEKPTKYELEMVVAEGLTLISGEHGALAYIKEEIRVLDLEIAGSTIGNNVREAAMTILEAIEKLMENIDKNLATLDELLTDIGNNQKKLDAADDQIKSLVELNIKDLEKIALELAKFNKEIFFKKLLVPNFNILKPVKIIKLDLLKDKRPALAVALETVTSMQERLGKFKKGVRLMPMPMPMPMPGDNPFEPIKRPDKPPVIEPVKPGAPATEAQLEELRLAQELLEDVKKWVEEAKEAKEKRKMKP